MRPFPNSGSGLFVFWGSCNVLVLQPGCRFFVVATILVLAPHFQTAMRVWSPASLSALSMAFQGDRASVELQKGGPVKRAMKGKIKMDEPLVIAGRTFRSGFSWEPASSHLPRS